MRTDDWPLAERPSTALSEGDVHLWRIHLDLDEPTVEGLASLLSEDEQGRAERFHFERHRRRFIVCRAAQRAILGQYLDQAAERLRFAYSQRGKPSLADNARRIRFNVSNSKELGLCAIAVGRELGVDIEQIREIRDLSALASRFFAKCEIADLDQLPAEQQVEAFYAIWTRKEALLKAIGTGLAFPLHEVEVTALPDQKCRVLRFGAEPDAERQWWLERFVPAAGYVGAVAARTAPLRVRRWTWHAGSEA